MDKPLIIFDCDGVLVETEHRAAEYMAEIFRGVGMDISAIECRKRFQGMAARDISTTVEQETGTKIDGEEIRRQVLVRLSTGIQAVDGVIELIKTLKKSNYDFCVASSGKIEKMHTTLGQSELLGLLKDVLFSADSVEHGKPSPGVFLYAAKNMGYAPTNAIVIEDSVPGVQAGIAAGCTVFGYCGGAFTKPKILANEGAITFTSMHDFLPLIELHT